MKSTGQWGLLHGLRPRGGRSSLAASGSQASFENETEVMAIANKLAWNVRLLWGSAGFASIGSICAFLKSLKYLEIRF